MKKFEVTFEGDQIPLGKRLNCVLRNKHIKQRDLAARVYVGETCISKYIYGKAYPSIPTLVLIAKELNVSTDYLLGFTSWPYEREN